jgi:hypothetical protein
MNLALLRVRCFRKTSAELSSTLKLFEGNLEHQYSLRAEGIFYKPASGAWRGHACAREALQEELSEGSPTALQDT